MNNLRIGVRLLSGFILLAGLTLVVGLSGYSGIRDTEESLNKANTLSIPSIQQLGAIRSDLTFINACQKKLLIQGYPNKAEVMQDIQTAREDYREALKLYQALPHLPEADALWKDFVKYLEQGAEYNQKIMGWIKEWETDPSKTKAYEQAVALAGGAFDTSQKQSMVVLGKIIGIYTASARQDQIRGQQEADSDIRVMVGVTVFAFLAAVGLGILLTRSLTAPIRRCLTFTQTVAGGDYSQQLALNRKDEIGGLADNLNTAFVKVIDKMFWYESIIDSISNPLSVTDMDMNWTFVNKAALAVTGAKREDILGKPCKNWGADICGTDRCGIACLRRGQPRSTFTQPGLERDFQVDSSFLLDRAGNRIGHIEMVQDITEANQLRAQAEQALKDGIHQAAQKLQGIVEVVTSASEELAAQIEQASRGAETQAERAGETATAMEEMNATVLEVAKNASQAAETSEKAKREAESGAQIVSRVVQGIDKVRSEAQELKGNMSSLGQQAEGIGQVMNVISDIADQTNLLALNAAIEAARAGEAGRGFAVVADEVRKLAEKTMTATKEVGESIQAIQQGSRASLGSVDKASEAIEEATGLAGESGEALRRIVELVDLSADQVRSIATASEEQSSASEEINHSVEEVNRISTETSQVMSQSAKAVSDLAEQSLRLKGIIEDMESGGAPKARALRASPLNPAG